MSYDTLLINGDTITASRDGKKKRCSPGWEKGWIFENVYGWTWIGAMRFPSFVNLVVLPYEPGPEERAQIEATYANSATPDGGPLFVDPFA